MLEQITNLLEQITNLFSQIANLKEQTEKKYLCGPNNLPKFYTTPVLFY